MEDEGEMACTEGFACILGLISLPVIIVSNSLPLAPRHDTPDNNTLSPGPETEYEREKMVVYDRITLFTAIWNYGIVGISS